MLRGKDRPGPARSLLAAAGLIGAALLVVPTHAGAAPLVIQVATTADGHGPGTLRSAIDTANSTAGPVEIVLPPGTYPLTLCGAPDDDANATGDLDHTGGETTLRSSGDGATIEQQCAGERVLEDLGPSLRLAHLVVTGGHALREGGGVQAAGAVHLDTVSFTANSVTGVTSDPLGLAAAGGGLAVHGPLTANGALFFDNHAIGSDGPEWDPNRGQVPTRGGDASGGGLYAAGPTTSLTGTAFTANTATAGSGGAAPVLGGFRGDGGTARGGGLTVTDAITATDLVVTGNTAQGGTVSGVAVGGGLSTLDADLHGARIVDNHARGGSGANLECGTKGGGAEGGGLDVRRDLTADHLALRTNDATAGPGGASTADPCPTFATPGAPAQGGGARVVGTATVTDSEITGNSAVGGTGAFNAGVPVFSGVGGDATGGGLLAGPTDITGSTIESNVARAAAGTGAGVYWPAGGGSARGGGIAGTVSVSVAGSLIQGNQALGGDSAAADVFGPAGTATGGGVDAPSGAVTVHESALVANAAVAGEPMSQPSAGGGVHGSRSDLTVLRNVTSFQNRPNEVTAGPTEIVYGTIEGAPAADEAEATALLPVLDRYEPALPLVLRGAVIVARGAAACGAPATSSSWSRSSDASCALAGPGDADEAADPMLGPLELGTQRAPSRAPLAGSPLLDAIPAADCLPPAFDQHLTVRPSGPGCEIGSVEIPVPPPDTTTTTSTTSTISTTSTTSTTVSTTATGSTTVSSSAPEPSSAPAGDDWATVPPGAGGAVGTAGQGGLARTGAELGGLTAFAVALAAGGGLLAALARRRRTRPEPSGD